MVGFFVGFLVGTLDGFLVGVLDGFVVDVITDIAVGVLIGVPAVGILLCDFIKVGFDALVGVWAIVVIGAIVDVV